jgi:hypothetical protein
LVVSYPYTVGSTLELSVRQANGDVYGSLFKFHTVNITEGTTADAIEWVKQKTRSNQQTDKPSVEDKTSSISNTTSSTTSTGSETNNNKGIVGKWEACDMVTSIHTGEDILYIWRWTFNSDGTVSHIQYMCNASEQGSHYYFGKRWSAYDGERGDGTYKLNGNSLSVTAHEVNGNIYSTSEYTVETVGETLRITDEMGMTRNYTRID